MTDHQLDVILQALQQEDGAHLGSIAGEVMARVRRRRAVRWWIPAAAAAALAVMALWPAKEDRLPISMPPGPAAPVVSAQAKPAGRDSVRPTRLIKQMDRSAPLGAVEVRMQTDDPDVLIIWLIDGEE